jgi:hypothetical protein
MVQEGAIQKVIMEKLGFKTANQFKVAYLNAAMKEGIVPEVKGGRSAKKKVWSPEKYQLAKEEAL